MDKETLGVVLGWVIVTVAAWFVALALLGYAGGNILPWTWSVEKRTWHLIVQFALILGYASWTRPRRAG